MDKIETLLYGLHLPIFWIKFFCGTLAAFAISFLTIPTIIKISRRKNLMDEPGLRSSHLRKIPNLGGIAIVYAISICASVFAYELFDLYKFLFASIIILLFVGVMDDIVVMCAYKKLIAQVVVSVLMVVGSDVRIRSLFGVFGIFEIGYFLSVILTVLVFIILINAFNLIDGIDGLAGCYSAICSLLFGASYFRLGAYNYPLVVFCGVIIGAVLGFLYYNLSGYRNRKIFMGDTGSMVLGFLLAFTAINFINIFIDRRLPDVPRYHLQTAPVIAVAILILPLVDTLSVIFLRLKSGKSLFIADKNHIHHKLLRLALTHRRSTFYILLYYLGIVAVAYLGRHLGVNLLLAIVLALGIIGAWLPDFILRLRANK